MSRASISGRICITADLEEKIRWRLNEGNVKNHTTERLDSMVGGISGKRLTYARLTA